MWCSQVGHVVKYTAHAQTRLRQWLAIKVSGGELALETETQKTSPLFRLMAKDKTLLVCSLGSPVVNIAHALACLC